jgi:hypothetical protein
MRWVTNGNQRENGRVVNVEIGGIFIVSRPAS